MKLGFYKKQEDNEMLYAPNIVEGNSYVLVAQDKDEYDYPVDGWTWFNSEKEAISFFKKSIE